MNCSFEMPIPAPVAFVLERLSSSGYSAYCVGGCVRDALMGKTPDDYDVTTSARPSEMLRVFADCRVVETGLKHGTLTVVSDGMNIEITTYRIDGEYGDCRHPEGVTFTDRLSDDLCRRDFTVNAMAYSPTASPRGLVDLYGGQDDLQKCVIRCVGRAQDRFSEDGLRLMRALRFSSVLGFSPDGECADAVRKMTPLLAKISRERIYTELSKLLSGKKCADILAAFPATIAFALGIPEENVVCAARLIEKDEETPDLPMRYALLCDGLDIKAAEAVIDSLKPSREEKRAVMSYLSYRSYETCGEYSVLKLISERGDAFPAALARYRHLLGLISDSDRDRTVSAADRVIRENRCRSLGDLAVNGTELAALGLKGRSIGDALAALLDSVMRGDEQNEKNALLARAKALIDMGEK